MTTSARTPDTTARSPLFSALVGITTLLVLLQGLWAGLFLGGSSQSFVGVHNWGGNLSLLTALGATGVGYLQLRARRDLWIGALVLTLALVLEIGLGQAVDASGGATLAVHVPLAMLIMGLAVWIPLRTRARA